LILGLSGGVGDGRPRTGPERPGTRAQMYRRCPKESLGLGQSSDVKPGHAGALSLAMAFSDLRKAHLAARVVGLASIDVISKDVLIFPMSLSSDAYRAAGRNL
jgi:hypothetical protein